MVSLDEVVDETTNDGGSSGSERKQELPLKVLSVDTGLTEFLFHKITHANLGAEEGDLDVEATIDLELKIFKVGSQILLSGAEETTDESTEGLSDTRSSSLGDCTEDRSSTTKEGTKSTEHTEVFFLGNISVGHHLTKDFCIVRAFGCSEERSTGGTPDSLEVFFLILFHIWLYSISVVPSEISFVNEILFQVRVF